jgi:hypothetical protein
VVSLLSVAPVVGLVTEWAVVAGAEPVAVEGEEMMAFVAHTELLAVEDQGGLGSLRKPMGHMVRAVAGVAVVVAAVCVGPVDNLDRILFHLAGCSFLIEFGHMQEQLQRSCPLPPWQRWRQQLKTALYLAEDAVAR